MHSSISSRLGYTINIIDAPGFGATRGIEHDKQIVDQIRELFASRGAKGVATIDAMCFVLKAPDSILTSTQKYIFEAILSLFGNDIKGLQALEHKSLPYDLYFTFNNSALFAENTATDQNNLSPTFWEMGMRSCKSFFDHLVTLQTKSLLLTSEVLAQRQRLEHTVQHLYEEIDCGLPKISVLEQEISIFTVYRREIRENKNFVYEVIEEFQEKIDCSGTNQFTTNCLTCNFTCHENCAFANDNDKEQCCAMGSGGNCTECPSKCHWTQHHNTPYIIKLVPKKKKKKYSEKQKNYEEASQKSLTQEQLLQEMTKDIDRLEYAITGSLDRIAQYNNRLKEIALRPDPLSTISRHDN
jgi:hypothetical protein